MKINIKNILSVFHFKRINIRSNIVKRIAEITNNIINCLDLYKVVIFLFLILILEGVKSEYLDLKNASKKCIGLYRNKANLFK